MQCNKMALQMLLLSRLCADSDALNEYIYRGACISYL